MTYEEAFIRERLKDLVMTLLDVADVITRADKESNGNLEDLTQAWLEGGLCTRADLADVLLQECGIDSGIKDRLDKKGNAI